MAVRHKTGLNPLRQRLAIQTCHKKFRFLRPRAQRAHDLGGNARGKGGLARMVDGGRRTTQELELYEPMVNQLKEATGKKVEFYLPTSYASVVEAMLGGFVDIGMHGPYSYVIAQEKDPSLRVFATYAKHKGHFQEEGPGYKAVEHKGQE